MRPQISRRNVAVGAALLTFLLGLLLAALPGPAGANPAWSIVTSPDGGTRANLLPGVSCLSDSDCLAVGYYENNDLVRQTLIETWNGATWSIVPSPNVGTKNNELNGVSCASPTWCRAVGDYDNGSGATENLVESWNGTTWAIVPSPEQGASNSLDNVTCISTTWCTAIGSFVNAVGVTQSLVESWNGASWSIVPTPDEGAHSNFLDNLSCDSTTWCVAAGYFYNGSAVTETLVESWNGATWSIVPTPNRGTGSNTLLGVSCTSTRSCTAVGYDVPTSPVIPGGIHAVNLVESWNGTTWSIVPSPNEGAESNNLFDVSCVSPTSCIAVGSEYEGKKPKVSHTLIESWNGTSWSVVPSPNYGRTKAINLLLGVSCLPSGSCAAVGYHNINTRTFTLIESLATMPVTATTTTTSRVPTTTTTDATPTTVAPTTKSGGVPAASSSPTTEAAPTTVAPTPKGGVVPATSSSLAFTGPGAGLKMLTLFGIALMLLGLVILILSDIPRRMLRHLADMSPGRWKGHGTDGRRRIATAARREVVRGTNWFLGR